jgi:hypothetical protein
MPNDALFRKYRFWLWLLIGIAGAATVRSIWLGMYLVDSLASFLSVLVYLVLMLLGLHAWLTWDRDHPEDFRARRDKARQRRRVRNAAEQSQQNARAGR